MNCFTGLVLSLAFRFVHSHSIISFQACLFKFVINLWACLFKCCQLLGLFALLSGCNKLSPLACLYTQLSRALILHAVLLCLFYRIIDAMYVATVAHALVK